MTCCPPVGADRTHDPILGRRLRALAARRLERETPRGLFEAGRGARTRRAVAEFVLEGRWRGGGDVPEAS
jgi:hypothetical protein